MSITAILLVIYTMLAEYNELSQNFFFREIFLQNYNYSLKVLKKLGICYRLYI